MIPGVDAFHPRTEWEQIGFRMAVDFTRQPTGFKVDRVDTMVAHYTGAKNVPDGDPGEDLTTMRDYLRAIQRDYLANRTGGGYTRKMDAVYFPGYHIGYSFGIDWQGGVWELRGFDYLPAATNAHNDHTVAVLFFVDGPDGANDGMWAAARAIGREVRDRSRHPLFRKFYTDHGTLTATSGAGTPTACAGPGIRSQLLVEGNLDHDEGDDEMKPILWRPFGYANVFIIQGFQAIHASEALIKAWGLNINNIIDDPNPQTLRSVLFFSGLTEADLVK